MEPLFRARVVGIDCSSSSLLGAIQTVCLPCGGGHQFCAFVVATIFFFFFFLEEEEEEDFQRSSFTAYLQREYHNSSNMPG